MKDKKRIVIFTLILMLLGIISFALSYTSKKQLKYVHTNDYLYNKSVNDAIDKTQDNSGELRINLSSIDEYSRYLTFRFKNNAEYGSIYDIYLYSNGEYSALNRLEYAFTYSKSGYLVVDLKDLKNVAAIGIPYPILDSIQNVEFHKNPHTLKKVTIPFKYTRFIVLLLISILVDLGIMYLMKDTDIELELNRRELFRKTLKIILCILLFVFVSYVIEKGVVFGGGKIGLNTAFRFKRFVFYFVSFLLIGWLYLYRGQYSKKTDKVFLGVILLTGILFILLSPVYHNGWDIDTHYRNSVTAASLGDSYQTASDLYITNARGVSLVKSTYQENQDILKLFNEQDDYIYEVTTQNVSLAHLPAGIGIAVGRLFSFSFYKTYLLGELCNLILYSILSCLAIRKLKSGKFILATIALIPTNVFMASCFNYDYWVLGFSYLGIAYFVSICQNEGMANYKDEIICCLSLMLSCVPKQNYILILFLPFLLPMKKIKKKVTYYTIAIMPFVITGISLALRTVVEMSSPGGDVRGGGGVNPIGQLDYMIHHIAPTMVNFVRFFFSAISFGYIEDAMTTFGNLGYYKLGGSLIVISIIAAVVFDRDSVDNIYSYTRFKVFTLVYYASEVLLIAAVFYLVFTPVGSDVIAGVQPRYYTPMLLPLALCIAPPKSVLENKNKLAITTFVIPTMISFLSIATVMLTRCV